jgi:hypothetical protein
MGEAALNRAGSGTVVMSDPPTRIPPLDGDGALGQTESLRGRRIRRTCGQLIGDRHRHRHLRLRTYTT